MARYGSIEGGGTKFVCAVGTGPGDLARAITVPTTTPNETLGRAVEFFTEHGPLGAIGIAMFGPLALDPTAPDYGHVRKTPKPGWSGADVVGVFAEALGIPIGFDTDVNGAA
ncbi:MAG TPA: ROK family protein, partial [Acidimicrobiia bacterium]|nr:ROK family protein [Acidimicrobiia bacterium]